MAIIGHWLHFGYSDMMKMEVSVFMQFIDECDFFAQNVP